MKRKKYNFERKSLRGTIVTSFVLIGSMAFAGVGYAVSVTNSTGESGNYTINYVNSSSFQEELSISNPESVVIDYPEYEEQIEEPQISEIICEEVVPVSEWDFSNYHLPTYFKSYMDYRKLTDETSDQWAMQQEAYTDPLTGVRKIGDDYLVALGTNFGNSVGHRFLITLDSGFSFTVVTGDIKADEHTDDTNTYRSVFRENGEHIANVVEFIIDYDVLSVLFPEVIRDGDVSSLSPYERNEGIEGIPNFNGNIISVKELELDKNLSR